MRERNDERERNTMWKRENECELMRVRSGAKGMKESPSESAKTRCGDG